MLNPIQTRLAVYVMLTLIITALAIWPETLVVNTRISTGNVDIDVEDPQVIEGNEYGKTWVAECYVDITDSDEDSVVGVTIIVENAYPGYNCSVYFKAVNRGTIPVIGPFYKQITVPEGLKLMYTPNNTRQLHPNEYVEHVIAVEVLQEANQSTTYEVVLHIEYIQWNEAPRPETPAIIPTTISGYVFNDVDGDGVWDPNEGPLAGVLIELLENGTTVGSTYSNQSGFYSFTVYVTATKTYIIRAYALPGYNFTTPYEITLTVEPGRNYGNNNFGMSMYVRGLSVTKDFRKTDEVNLDVCPASLGDLLPMQGSYYVVNVNIVKGKVQNVSPGALYGVVTVGGYGITQVNLTDRYDYHFDVEDGGGGGGGGSGRGGRGGGGGGDGKVRVYVYNLTSGCAAEVGTLTYSVDNTNNVVTANITLGKALGNDEVVLIYLKFKPSDWLVGSQWGNLDKYFENVAEIKTNIGSATANATIMLVAK